MVFGYARVAKGADHGPQAQVAAVRAAGGMPLCTEPAAGGRWDGAVNPTISGAAQQDGNAPEGIASPVSRWAGGKRMAINPIIPLQHLLQVCRGEATGASPESSSGQSFTHTHRTGHAARLSRSNRPLRTLPL
jgi:hypothetical protein